MSILPLKMKKIGVLDLDKRRKTWQVMSLVRNFPERTFGETSYLERIICIEVG